MSRLADVLELLHTAGTRYRNAQITVWQAPGNVIRTTYEPPHHAREELLDEEGRTRGAAVWNGDLWWRWGPGGAMTNQGADGLVGTPAPLGIDLLDPAWLITCTRLRVLGEEERSGRRGFVVEATPRDPDEPPHATEIVVVDAESGVVLTRRPPEDEERGTYALEIAFDLPLHDSWFRLDLPEGQSFEPVTFPRLHDLRLEDAAELLPFPLLVPGRLPAGSRLENCTVRDPSKSPHGFRLPFLCDLMWTSRTASVTVSLARAGDQDVEDIVEARDGYVAVHRAGVRATIRSSLPTEMLLEIARSLELYRP